MDLRDSTWTDVETATTDLALIPVGSTEQHGPHAPLATDTLTAEAVAAAGAEKYEKEVIITPTLPVGVSAEHRDFPGTLWLRPETLRAYVRDTAKSLAAHDFRKIIIVNGHGGNTSSLREVAASLIRSEDLYVVPFTWFEAVDVPIEMGHAGALETAMLRHHHPDLIQESEIDRAHADGSDQWGIWVSGVNLAYSTKEFSESGVIGDPNQGDGELGEELTQQAGSALADLLAAVNQRSPAG